MDAKLAVKLNYLAGKMLLEVQCYFDHCVPITSEQSGVIERVKAIRNEIAELLLDNVQIDMTPKGDKNGCC